MSSEVLHVEQQHKFRVASPDAGRVAGREVPQFLAVLKAGDRGAGCALIDYAESVGSGKSHAIAEIAAQDKRRIMARWIDYEHRSPRGCAFEAGYDNALSPC